MSGELTHPVYLEEKLREISKSGRLDYRSQVLPTWCPGCGYFSIAEGLTSAFTGLGITNEDTVIVSGIGCASRFPFFVEAYGFHTLHGRALPVATGVKLANDKLCVVAIGGDGDGFAIGGGHIPHVARRNIDITYLLLDNSIYGLTKGQTSPTAEQGTVSKTSPFGSDGLPLNAIQMVLSYGGSFVARAFSGYPHELQAIIKKAVQHKGFSFVQVLSPCVMFNKEKTYDLYYDICKPFPSNYKHSHLEKAMTYALNRDIQYLGVFYLKPRKVFSGGAE